MSPTPIRRARNVRLESLTYVNIRAFSLRLRTEASIAVGGSKIRGLKVLLQLTSQFRDDVVPVVGLVLAKRRMVGYQGVSGRFNIQRQSGAKGSITQTGKPNAPARWAGAVSTLMIRSRAVMAAAVSMKSVRRSPISVIANCAANPGNCSRPAPFCRLTR